MSGLKSCYEKNREDCEDHYVCEEFFMGDEPKDGASDGNNDVSKTGPDFEEIQLLCAKDYISDFGTGECEFECEAVKCKHFACCILMTLDL